jgi:hypothetical protein
MQTVKLAESLGVEASEVPTLLQVKLGDQITKGQTLAQTKGMFGFFKSEFKSPVGGKLELISEATGHLGVRLPPIPIEKDAYVAGTISEIIEREGVVIRCQGAMVQGIFGVGGERQGVIEMVCKSSDEPLTDAMITAAHKDKIIVGGSNISLAGLKKAHELGVRGIVVGGIIDRDLIDYLRGALNDPTFDIGVAITGQEAIPITLMVTEGFGVIRMAQRTFDLLQSLAGKTASINGATQIRAGVIRPEVIVPFSDSAPAVEKSGEEGELVSGTPIRAIREPYFGLLGNVTGLPSELQQVDSETWVRVLEAKLEDGRNVTIPRANVEIIQTD